MTVQEAVSEKLNETATALLDRPEVKQQVDRVRGQLAEMDTQARRVVQEQPMVAVGAALAFGYLLGRLLAKR
jgi:ElaB/YqjD/DUF883 family membrane-anchored ribosome-binding protein